MKILFVTESYWPNHDGGAVFEHRLVHQLAKAGHDVTVWAPGTKYTSYEQQDNDTLIYREKSKMYVFNPRYRTSYWPWLKAQRVIRKVQPDIIHIHNAGGLGLAALLWAKIMHIPVVASNHFMPENASMNFPGPAFVKKIVYNFTTHYLVWFHNRFDAVIAPTETAVRLLTDNGMKRPAQAITNGVDADLFTSKKTALDKALYKKYGLNPDVVKLLYLGRVDGEKCVDQIIEAFALLPDSLNVQLVIAGRGKEIPALKVLAEQRHVADHVAFTGFVDDDDKPKLYQSCDVFTIASPAELQSIVCLEAMATGLPLITVDVAALSELCHTAENGYLFDEGDIRGYAARMEQLLSNAAVRHKFGAVSRDIIEKHHTQAISLERHLNTYHHVLQSRGETN